MKAPEKIYLQVCGDCYDNDCENCKFEDLEDNVTWCRDKIFDKDIEYVQADAFIEKAEMYLKGRLLRYIDLYIRGVAIITEEFIEEFKRYMDEEYITYENRN